MHPLRGDDGVCYRRQRALDKSCVKIASLNVRVGSLFLKSGWPVFKNAHFLFYFLSFYSFSVEHWLWNGIMKPFFEKGNLWLFRFILDFFIFFFLRDITCINSLFDHGEKYRKGIWFFESCSLNKRFLNAVFRNVWGFVEKIQCWRTGRNYRWVLPLAVTTNGATQWGKNILSI